ETRSNFAMKEDTLPSLERRQDLAKFYFWTAWASATERPGTSVTYTNNWPHEPLIENKPSAANIVWSLMSIVILLNVNSLNCTMPNILQPIQTKQNCVHNYKKTGHSN